VLSRRARGLNIQISSLFIERAFEMQEFCYIVQCLGEGLLRLLMGPEELQLLP